ncbi:hypothetical protein H9L15_03240 [Sphingomonas daechungensis]|uniref:GP-PDE domain-containing protein n=1 Tax=Sphingomonas daechungensis TaxID=1176646 RepID=A0ABX6T485_9SPHN|nr:hypothetical protein H9L15_03240 [Sphingomonas daechungensis]
MAVFHDWTVDCRTNGKGNIRDKTIAEVKLLDPGYGYTADSGKTFPFRGRQVGTIPTLQEALNALPSSPIIFNFKGTDAGKPTSSVWPSKPRAATSSPARTYSTERPARSTGSGRFIRTPSPGARRAPRRARWTI